MDYAEVIEKQARLLDDVLMAAATLPKERFVEAGPGGAPSLRDLFVAWIDAQRKIVHRVFQDRVHVPLAPERFASALEIGPALGGLRLSLLDHVRTLSSEDLAKECRWPGPGGEENKVTTDDVLAHLILHDARMRGAVAERLRILGAPVAHLDLLG